MKLELLNTEANKIWKRHAPQTQATMLQLELELYKKLLSFFQVGDYYYYIFNFQTLDFDMFSPSVEQLLGYNPSESSAAFWLGKIHPDDSPYVLSFEEATSRFFATLPPEKIMKYKNRYDYRMQKKDGSYIRILHQASIVQMDENNNLIRTLGVHTDITHLKKEGRPVMSLIGLDGEPSYLDVDVKNAFIESKSTLTNREKDVLRLLIEGRPSKQIGDMLHISKQTVDTHRKNMLRKNSLNNTGELIGKAITQGWL